MCSVYSCIKFSFKTNELQNFHRLEPFLSLLKCWKEQKKVEWSVDMAPKTSDFLIISWKLQKIKT